jgi:hypothetical protein
VMTSRTTVSLRHDVAEAVNGTRKRIRV